MSKQNPRPMYLITRYIKSCGDNAPKLQEILDDHLATFLVAKGSNNKHQAWPGGYLQHVADCMSLIAMFFNMTNKYWQMPFSRASAMLIMFLHDIEKPFMQQQMCIKPDMEPWTKQQRMGFRNGLIARYGIQLTEEEWNALRFVEGEGDDYDPTKRVMNELAALCHMADIGSARVWPNRNKPENTEP